MQKWITRLLLTTATVLVALGIGMGIHYLTSKDPRATWIDETLQKNLQIVRPKIDSCLINGGAWTWAFGPQGVLGFCITEEDMNNPTPKVTKPKKSDTTL